MVGGGRHFGLGGLQKLLVAPVDQLGNFAADQVSGIGEDLHAVVAVFLDGGGDVVFLEEHAALRARSFDQVKTVLAQPADRVFVSSLLYFGCHSFWVSNPSALVSATPFLRCHLAKRVQFHLVDESKQPLL